MLEYHNNVCHGEDGRTDPDVIEGKEADGQTIPQDNNNIVNVDNEFVYNEIIKNPYEEVNIINQTQEIYEECNPVVDPVKTVVNPNGSDFNNNVVENTTIVESRVTTSKINPKDKYDIQTLKKEILKLQLEFDKEKSSNYVLQNEIKLLKQKIFETNNTMLDLKTNNLELKNDLRTKNILINKLANDIKEITDNYKKKFENLLIEEEAHRNKLLEKINSKIKRHKNEIFEEGVSITKFIENTPKSNKIILNHTNIFNQIQPLQTKGIKSNTPSKKINNIKTNLLGYDIHTSTDSNKVYKTDNMLI
jgi:hypothetical protein